MPKNRIHRLKDGRYTYSATDSTGERQTIKSRKGETKTKFSRRCDELDVSCDSEIRCETMDELFNLWFEGHVKKNLGISESYVTESIYRNHVQPFLGHKRISDIKRLDVYSVLSKASDNGLSRSTIKHVRGCISRPYNWSISSLGMDITSPTQGLVFASKNKNNGKKKDKVIDDESMERFLQAAEASKYYPYFRVLQLTGMRPSEALGLQARDVTDRYIQVRRAITRYGQTSLKNTTAERSIPITSEIEKVLRKPVQNSKDHLPGWLFPALEGEPSMYAVRMALRRINRKTARYKRGGRNGMKKLSLLEPPTKINLYDFRHTFATKLVQAGVNPKALQTIMGHKTISVTLKYYVGMTDEMYQEVKNLMSKSL